MSGGPGGEASLYRGGKPCSPEGEIQVVQLPSCGKTWPDFMSGSDQCMSTVTPPKCPRDC